jgi:hypothetical protein
MWHKTASSRAEAGFPHKDGSPALGRKNYKKGCVAERFFGI